MAGDYLLDNRALQAQARFEAFAELFDPSTFRHLDAVGIAPGWRCWEVGAGGTSVVRWLASRVGRRGRVVATDIDVSLVNPAAGGCVEVIRHDAGTDPPPGRGFDLAHARLVLVHVPARDAALRSMVASLRPGGWLVVEDADPSLQPLSVLDAHDSAEDLANRLRTGFRSLMADRGVDLAYGRKLPRLLRGSGLTAVSADAYFPVALPACAALETATIGLIRDQLVGGHVATEADVEEHLANVASGRLDLAQPPMITAWGRKPGD